MKHTFSVLTSALFLFKVLCAQSTSNYAFNTGTSESLSLGGTSNVSLTLMNQNNDNAVSTVESIGFDFWLMGKMHNQFTVSSNGIIRLGNSTISGSTYQIGQASQALIAPFAGDLATGTSRKILRTYYGSSPNAICVIDFINMSLDYTTSPFPNNGSYQVRLYQNTGVIEFVYGSMFRNSSSDNSGSFNIGFSSSSGNGNVFSVKSSDLSVKTDGTIITNTYTPNTSIPNLSSIWDGLRRYFKVTPPITTAPVNLSFSDITSTSMKLSWANTGSNRVVTAIYYSIDNTNFSYLTAVSAASSSYTAASLSPGKTYYWKLYAVSEGYVSSTLSGSQSTYPNGQWIGPTSSDWNTASNWAGNAVPNSSTDVADAFDIVRVSDFYGQNITEQKIVVNETSTVNIPVSNIPGGIYFVTLIGKNKVITKKIIM